MTKPCQNTRIEPLRNYLKMELVWEGESTSGGVKIGESCVVVEDGEEGDSANDLGNTG